MPSIGEGLLHVTAQTVNTYVVGHLGAAEVVTAGLSKRMMMLAPNAPSVTANAGSEASRPRCQHGMLGHSCRGRVGHSAAQPFGITRRAHGDNPLDGIPLLVLRLLLRQPVRPNRCRLEWNRYCFCRVYMLYA